jgi:hypothetical protein
MAFLSGVQIARDRAQHIASVLALSFEGFYVQEAPKGGEFRGNFIARTKKPISYLEKPITLYFNTGASMSLASPTSVSITQGPIGWAHARLAPKVWAKLPELLPTIHTTLRDYLAAFIAEAALAEELEEPSVVLDSTLEESTDPEIWKFEIMERDSQIGHYFKFRSFELLEHYAVG